MRLTSDKKIFVPDEDDWYRWGADYEQNEYDNIIKYIPNFDVALDVGAHVGIWSRRLAEKFKTVVAFEPVPKHIECWHANVTNDFNNVDVEDVALSNVEGTAMMKVPNVTNTGMASLVHEVKDRRWVQSGWEDFPEIEVKTRILDSYEFDQLDFIKIDVEWYEHKVLQGAISTIQKHKPIIYIEIHDMDAYVLLHCLGYKCYHTQGSNRLFKYV